MADDTPQATPQGLPLSAAGIGSIGGVAASGSASVQYRPARGVRTYRIAGSSPFGDGREDGYTSPAFSEGIAGSDIKSQTGEAQREIVSYWFRLNFAPENDFGKLERGFASEISGRLIDDDTGVAMGVPGVHKIGAIRPATIEEDPLSVIRSEFGSFVPIQTLALVADSFRQQSPTWFFVPLPRSLAGLGASEPSTANAEGALVSEIARVLLKHMAMQPTGGPASLQTNYQQGAELFEVTPGLGKAAGNIEQQVSLVTPSASAVEQEVGRIRKLVGQIGKLLRDAVLKETASSAVKAAPELVSWGERLFFYANELAHHAPNWLSLLFRG